LRDRSPCLPIAPTTRTLVPGLSASSAIGGHLTGRSREPPTFARPALALLQAATTNRYPPGTSSSNLVELAGRLWSYPVVRRLRGRLPGRGEGIAVVPAPRAQPIAGALWGGVRWITHPAGLGRRERQLSASRLGRSGPPAGGQAPAPFRGATPGAENRAQRKQ
jgi:hypothetical protein